MSVLIIIQYFNINKNVIGLPNLYASDRSYQHTQYLFLSIQINIDNNINIINIGV
jgi:hypothetical protein